MPHPVTIRPSPYQPPTREQIERARAMYAEGFTVSRVLAACDMSLGTLYYWLDGGPGENGVPLFPPIARRRVVLGKRRPVLKADRVSLAARITRTAERQARDIEQRLAKPSGATPERERDVRMLSVLVRTLRDLSGFDSAPPDLAPTTPSLAEARISLARKELMRGLDDRMRMIRDVATVMFGVRKAEAELKAGWAALNQAREKKAKTEAEDDEMRRDLARRIKGFVEAGRQQSVASAAQSEHRTPAADAPRT